jgi:hypothetical protein
VPVVIENKLEPAEDVAENVTDDGNVSSLKTFNTPSPTTVEALLKGKSL